MPLRVLGGPLPTRKVRKLGAWTRPGNAWNGGESVGLIGGLIGGAARRAEGRRTVSSSTCRCTFAFVNTGRPGDKLMTAPPFFEPGMHPTEWGRKTHHEPAPKTGLRAQLARGFHLTLGSLRVLATEPRMMALPFLALVFTGFVWLIVVLSVLALGLPPTSPSSGFLYQEIFGAYLVTYFLSVYFMAAIIGAAAIRLQGQRPYVLDGIAAANASFFQILLWSFLAATVGVLLRFTSIRSDAGGRFVSRVLGYGWPIATLFVLPTMVLEGVGPVKSFRRSRALLRERWGAHQSGVLGTGLVFLLLFTVGLVPFVWGIVGEPGSLAWPVAAVLYWLILSALWSVVHGILVTTLYHYATDSEAAFGFSWQALNHPWIR